MKSEKRSEATVRMVEQAALVEMAKSAYASFRSTNLTFLFDYLRSIEGYRDNAQKFTKSTERKHLRKALIAFFSVQGDTYSEAESAADF